MRNLISIEAPVINCVFMNGIYTGASSDIIYYGIERIETEDVREVDFLKGI